MEKFRVLDLFAGIGGFSLGLERTGGFETVAFCEIEEFPRRVLAKHWPEVPQYHDVRTLTAEILARDGITVDVITGGFPCQDISVAGKQTGITSETRSGLWSEIVRLAGELRPQFIIVENVANLLRGPSSKPGAWFGRVLGDLAECGYDAEWENIPAAAVGAPHRRERVWIVAYPDKIRWAMDTEQRAKQHFAVLGQNKWQSKETEWKFHHWNKPHEYKHYSSPTICRMAHGLSIEVDRIAALGNSVVPQIPEIIGNAILQSIGWHESEVEL